MHLDTDSKAPRNRGSSYPRNFGTECERLRIQAYWLDVLTSTFRRMTS